jgi:hypothetical protein
MGNRLNKYERHIKEICDKHNIDIATFWHSGAIGINIWAADVIHKYIYIKGVIRTYAAYYSALHEIGHVLNEHKWALKNPRALVYTTYHKKGVRVPTTPAVLREIEAWDTALKLAKWWNRQAATRLLTQSSLNTYVNAHNDFHKKHFFVCIICEGDKYKKMGYKLVTECD